MRFFAITDNLDGYDDTGNISCDISHPEQKKNPQRKEHSSGFPIPLHNRFACLATSDSSDDDEYDTNKVSINSLADDRRGDAESTQIQIPNPKGVLPFVPTMLGPKDSKTKVDAFMLADSGSTHCILDLNAFKKMTNYEQYIVSHSSTASIVTASKTTVQVAYRAKIPVTFKDARGHLHTVSHMFFIVSGLAHTGYLGSDFLLNTSITRGFYSGYINLVEPIRKLKVVQIPISKMNSNKAIQLFSIVHNIIPPNSCKVIQAYTPEDVPYSLQLLIEEGPDREEDGSFEIIPSLQKKDEDDLYSVVIRNDSDDYYQIDANSRVAQVTPQNGSVNFMQIATLADFVHSDDQQTDQHLKDTMIAMEPCLEHSKDRNLISYPRLNSLRLYRPGERPTDTSEHEIDRLDMVKRFARKRLEDEEDLSQKEKDELISKLESDGYFSYSPSSLMHKHNNVAEIAEGSKERLTEEEIIAKVDLSHIDSSYHEQILQIIEREIEVFATHEFDLKICPLVTADVELTEEARNSCLNCRFTPIPFALREEVDRAIADMVQAGILCEVDQASPIISNLLVTKKKSGKLRFCLDLRLINHATKKIPCTVTPLMDVFQNFARKQFHSSIDVSNSFFSIPINPKKVPLFSFFDSKRKRYAWRVTPQGWKNSPQFLSQALNTALKDIADASVYCDDIFLSTAGTMEDHINAFGDVLHHLRINNFKIKPEKVQLLKPTIDVLGHCFDGQKFSIPKAKAQGFLEYPKPSTQKKLKGFIAACSFFRRMIPRFSEKTLPMHELIRGDHRKFAWTPTADEAFFNMRKEMASATGFYPADPKRRLYLASDASNYCCSFIIWDLDDDGNQRFIASSSRLFSQTERNYSTFKKEVVSVLAGLSSFDSILRFAEDLMLLVDARSILFLRAAKASSPILTRFALAISCYNLEIRHIKGSEHVLPDVLSRSIEPSTDDNITPMTEKEAEELLTQLTLPNGYNIDRETLKKYLTDDGLPSLRSPKKKAVQTTAKIDSTTFKPAIKRERKIKMPKTTAIHPFYKQQRRELQEQQPDFSTADSLLNTIQIVEPDTHREILEKSLQLNGKILSDGLITLELFKECQQSDVFCSDITGKTPIPRGFSVQRGILIKNHQNIDKLVLPESLLPVLINNLHFSMDGRHSSHTNMTDRISETYYLPNLANKLKQVTASCVLCCTQKPAHGKPHSFGKKAYSSSARSEWLFDIACGFNTINGYKYILLFVDSLSMYTIMVPSKTRDSTSILRAIRDHIVVPFMKPQRIYGDNEPALFSREVQTFCTDNHIALTSASPHSPFSNGVPEKTVQLTKDFLRIFTKQTGESWLKLLPDCATSLNSRRLSTGYTPEKLFFGTSLKEDPLMAKNTICTSEEEFFKTLQRDLFHSINQHITRRTQNAAASRKHANKGRERKTYRLGQLVALKNFALAQIEGGALQSKFTGPYRIKEIDLKEQRCLLESVKDNHTRTAHIMHLQPVEEPTGHGISYKVPIKNEASSLITGVKHSYNLRSHNSNSNVMSKQTV